MKLALNVVITLMFKLHQTYMLYRETFEKLSKQNYYFHPSSAEVLKIAAINLLCIVTKTSIFAMKIVSKIFSN